MSLYTNPSAPGLAAEEAPQEPTPQGDVHLHWIHREGRGEWRVRTHTSKLCGTPQCRKVTITPVPGDIANACDGHPYGCPEGSHDGSKRTVIIDKAAIHQHEHTHDQPHRVARPAGLYDATELAKADTSPTHTHLHSAYHHPEEAQ